MPKHSKPPFARSQAGISLIEVLVALLVFGVGVVGYAALQLQSVRQVEQTYSRSQAMSVAQDVAERIRANNTQAALAIYHNADSWSQDLNDPGGCVVTAAVPGIGDVCTPEEMARSDIFEVRSGLVSLLENGKVQVAPCDEIRCITVAWDETELDNCDETAFVDGERGANAHCIQIPLEEG
ncbi:MAG: type IV pilus modification protein PilV [Pseudomonadota bacterium]|nr:type IV pilus modification protein PilV [Pseudomonadota bacterium]